jgi:pimeloyl-ACP methyl ester carboxylesterase
MGSSDRTAEPATLEVALEDMVAVMNAAGTERAVVFGVSEGAALGLLFAATFPERTAGLVSFGGSARVLQAPDYPWGRAPGDGAAAALEGFRRVFEGPRDEAVELISWIGNLSTKDSRTFVDCVRESSDFPTASASVLLARTVDVRGVLPDIDTPTLIIHGQDDTAIPVGAARYLKEHIRGSRLLELPGERHLPTRAALAGVLEEIDRFLGEIAAQELV